MKIVRSIFVLSGRVSQISDEGKIWEGEEDREISLIHKTRLRVTGYLILVYSELLKSIHMA